MDPVGRGGGHRVFNGVSQINDFLDIRDKCLISMDFEGDPDFVWITLLKTPLRPCRSLENQAFQRIAHLLSSK
jgi:hypothetical protein